MSAIRLEILVTGQIQGVGFRPYVYQVATQLNLTGFVQNIASGVVITIQGKKAADFVSCLMTNLPPLAKINQVTINPILLEPDEQSFTILSSESGLNRTLISPDVSVCDACLHDIFDPNSRYFHYPFTSCTHCGPRLTITRDLPYDRDNTAMQHFILCESCLKDYEDPTHRRFHAQSTACPQCGPQLSLSLENCIAAICKGEIIALKAMGGYQLICDASNQAAIQLLRTRKNRPAKPFALMVADVDQGRQYADMDVNAETLLSSPARPIVLLPKKKEILPEEIAPGLAHIGIMLPNTPLHFLMFDALAKYGKSILVVTSANISGEPLIIQNKEANEKLQSIADHIIVYNRDIVTRVDDSLVTIIYGAPFFIRRARGYVPQCIPLAHEIPSTLALGGHLKNTFCITRGKEAFVSQHIGSLNNKATIDFYHESLNYFTKILSVKPECIAYDTHPDFYTSRLAHTYDLHSVAVQHHHAHLAAVAAEHHILEPALGLALDGYGYGSDGQPWGGELLLLKNNTYTRLGHLYPLPQVGGDITAHEPWRMAASILHMLGRNRDIATRFPTQQYAAQLAQLLENNLFMLTSSCGRLFDAASALLGINLISQYEGQAAMQLESLVTEPKVLSQGWSIDNNVLNMLATLQHLSNVDPITGANYFHGTLIAGLTEWIVTTAEKLNLNMILLSGGCFLNKTLTTGLVQGISARGLKVFIPRQLPPNDGGISLGQAWIAGRTFKCA